MRGAYLYPAAGILDVDMARWGAAFVAMPGHKGLLGPQGTGLLLCGEKGRPLLLGGSGSDSLLQEMPAYLPDRLEAGTQVPADCPAGRRAAAEATLRQDVEAGGIAAERSAGVTELPY